jgi:hypothetical protein
MKKRSNSTLPVEFQKIPSSYGIILKQIYMIYFNVVAELLPVCYLLNYVTLLNTEICHFGGGEGVEFTTIRWCRNPTSN